MFRKILVILSFAVAKLLFKTLSFEVIMHPNYKINQQYLYAFWHGKQFLGFFSMKQHAEKRAILVSPSRDGDVIAYWLRKLDFEVLRGSSRRNNIGALVSMMRSLKQGYSLGFAIDGPLGPIYKVKPGMTHMAQKLGIPIIPMGSFISRKWVFEKAWDKYEMPKPFSKARIYLGEPFLVSKEMDLNLSNQILEDKINEAELQARVLV